jgi:tetratricopeptide (TPR) repeat protein
MFDVALWMDAARRVGQAIRVRERIVARSPDTDAGRRALYLVGASYHALAMYAKAADAYERFALRFPGDTPDRCTEAERRSRLCPDAPAALRYAATFRLGLGGRERALADVRDFVRLYEQRQPQQAAEVSFAVGSIHESAGDHRAARDHWSAWLRRWERRADPGRVLEARVALGRASRAHGDADAAARAFADARAAWDAGVEERIVGETEDDRRVRRFLARGAAAEARFALAEEAFEAFLAIPWRPFRGGPFARWLERDFRRWHDEKRAALDAASAAFDAVAALRVPHWQIAAAARVGEMVRRFFTAFREAPVPPEVRRDPELLAIYQAELDRESEPWRLASIARFRECVDRAAEVRWFNEWSTQCEAQLQRLEPRRYPIAAEVRATASFVPDASAQPPLAATLR